MPLQERYGRVDYKPPSGIDWVIANNEDLAFNANLVTATNDTIETTIPYPQEWDPENEVCTMYQLTFAQQSAAFHQDDLGNTLSAYLSMIDRSAAATFRGILTDADDEWLKSIFARNMIFGDRFITPTVITGENLVSLPMDILVDAVYTPKLPIPAFFPVYLEISGQRVTVAKATGDETAANFAGFEGVIVDYDYTIRKMNRKEQNFFQGLPGMQQRWAQLGS